MHPLPRLHDLSTDVDDLPGAAYFRQAHNGVPVRMALFCDVFGVAP
jgi:aspartate carbamoyltransferase catalytic subunit